MKPAVSRVEKLPQAVFADGQVWRNPDRGPVPLLTLPDDEVNVAFGIGGLGRKPCYPGRRGRLGPERSGEGFEGGQRALGVDLHAAFGVQNPAGNPVGPGHPVNERSEANPLDDAPNPDAKGVPVRPVR